MTPTTFTNDEKKMLYSTAMEVGLAVMRASDSGFQGSVAELNAMVNAPEELAKQYPHNSVIQAILPVEEPDDGTPPPPESDSDWIDEGATEIEQDALAMCQNAADLVEMKASPDEATEYKRWVYLVAESVAKASREGGFWRRRHGPISEEEAKVLGDIRQALRLRET